MAVPTGTRPADLDRLVDVACAVAGYAPGARLIRHFANAVYLLDHAPVVVRVGFGPGVVDRAARAVAVTRWLADQDFPAIIAADPPSGADQPLTLDAGHHPVAVTFWRYYPHPAD